MESYTILKDLALIVIFAKLFGLVARKLRAPQVVGEILAGVIIGPSLLGLVSPTQFIAPKAKQISAALIGLGSTPPRTWRRVAM